MTNKSPILTYTFTEILNRRRAVKTFDTTVTVDKAVIEQGIQHAILALHR